MAISLPTRGQRDWDDELNNALNQMDANAESALASASSATSTANAALGVAQAAQNAVTTDLNARIARTTGIRTSLAQYGLVDTTPDISPIIAAAVSAGCKHMVVPYRASAWPALTTITLTDVRLEFEPGARISLDHSNIGVSLTRAHLTNAYFTSIHAGPSSVADATGLTYTFPAREITLNDDNLIDGSFYQERACNGLHMIGAHNRITGPVTFRDMRHQRGWAAAIHTSGAGAFDNRFTGPIHIEDCDRGIENEDGAHDIQYLGGGYLKNVFPNGYPAQASAASYEAYTFVLDAHAHEGTGGVSGIVFGNTWVVENCGTSVTFLRSTGANASDMPRGCRVDDLHIIGRGLSTGAEDLSLQGYDHQIGRVRFSEGSGIAGGVFRIKGFSGSTNNVVREIVHDSEAARPTLNDDGTGLRANGQGLPLTGAVRSGKFLSLPNRPVTTLNTLGNQTLRTVPTYIPYRVTIDQLGTEITAAGEAGSTVRCGIYSDFKGLPTTVLADVSVPGDAVATPMVTLGTPLVLEPGWYHVGGVVQGAATTQPTVRSVVNQVPDDGFLMFATTAGGSTSPLGYSRGGITGALPPWGTGIGIATTNIAPRLWARVTSAV